MWLEIIRLCPTITSCVNGKNTFILALFKAMQINENVD